MKEILLNYVQGFFNLHRIKPISHAAESSASTVFHDKSKPSFLFPPKNYEVKAVIQLFCWHQK